MIKYEFNKDDAYRFAREIGTKAKVNGNELVFDVCPYCKGGKNRDKGTFAVSLIDGAFNCKRSSCDAKGNMLTLEKDFSWFSLGREYDEYYKPKKVFKSLPQPKMKIQPKPFAVQYMMNRGISQETTEKYQITVRNDRQDVLCFPFYDENGVLQFIKYRNTNPESIKRFGKEYCEAECKPILFGMNLCNIENKTLVMTEGQIDSISLTEAGIENAVSVPTGVKGFTWVPYCWDWLHNFDTLIVFGDYEKGHITLVEDMARRFHGVVKHIREEDYKDCKDANDILRKYGKEYIKYCIDNSVPLSVNHVKSADDIKAVDNRNNKVLRTPFYTVNRILHGGLPYGGVTTITSKSGVGKTPLASYFAAEALKQGKKIFIYSGEMANGNTVSMLHFQIAGRQHIEKYRNEYGDYEPGIDDHTRKKISDWCRGRIFVYDDSPYTEGEDRDLIKAIRLTVERNGIEFVIIDNLMTAMMLYKFGQRIDENTKQMMFVDELVQMARQLNIVIVLVAHKRKASAEKTIENDENDEISGSGTTASLTAVTIGYNMPTEKEIENQSLQITEEQRWLTISKNRFWGKRVTGNKKIAMSYDPMSGRIYQEGHDDVDVKFGWEDEAVEQDMNVINNGFIMTDADF